MGRYDAYFERGVHLWDIATGALMCESVGLVVREIEDGMMAAPASLVDTLAEIIAGPAGSVRNAAGRIPPD